MRVMARTLNQATMQLFLSRVAARCDGRCENPRANSDVVR